ncbi:9848_t:CDS:1, partial [Scutellospora calospora]
DINSTLELEDGITRKNVLNATMELEDVITRKNVLNSTLELEDGITRENALNATLELEDMVIIENPNAKILKEKLLQEGRQRQLEMLYNRQFKEKDL